MKSAEDIYRNAKAIMSPDDPRMKMIQSALFTWLLKILDFLPQDDYTTEVNDILRKLSASTPFVELRFLRKLVARSDAATSVPPTNPTSLPPSPNALRLRPRSRLRLNQRMMTRFRFLDRDPATVS